MKVMKKFTSVRPKNIKVCLSFWPKNQEGRRVDFFLLIWTQKNAVSFMCCAFLGMQSPEFVQFMVWKGSCVPLYLMKVPFWDIYYLFWHSISTFLVENTKLKKFLPLFSNILGQPEKSKQTSFFFFFFALGGEKKNHPYFILLSPPWKYRICKREHK